MDMLKAWLEDLSGDWRGISFSAYFVLLYSVI